MWHVYAYSIRDVVLARVLWMFMDTQCYTMLHDALPCYTMRYNAYYAMLYARSHVQPYMVTHILTMTSITCHLCVLVSSHRAMIYVCMRSVLSMARHTRPGLEL